MMCMDFKGWNMVTISVNSWVKFESFTFFCGCFLSKALSHSGTHPYENNRRFAPCPCELIQSLIGGLYKNSPHQWDINGIVLGIESNPSMMRAHWLSLIHETLSFNQQNWCFLMGYSGDVTGRDLDVCVSNLFASSWNRGNLDAKIHQFCQLQEKKKSWTVISTPECVLFHSSECFRKLFWRPFSIPERPKGPERPQNRPLLGLVWT